MNTSTGTTNQTTYLWDFGNGVNSTEENPQYEYTHLGHYLVCLNIHDGSTGCSSHFCYDVNYQHAKHHFRTIEVQSSFESPTYSQTHISKGNGMNSVALKSFISNSNIQFEILKDGFVDIEICDLNGCKINSVSKEFLLKGIYNRKIVTDLMNNGLYVMKIILADQTYSRIFSVVK